MQDMYKQDVEKWKKIYEDFRKSRIINEVNIFTSYIICGNYNGSTTYTYHFYNRDENFVSDIANGMRKMFPDSSVVVNNYTIWSLFNYKSITVTWK